MSSRDKNKKNKNEISYSRENFFGDIVHYDAKGNKVGESRQSLFGGYTDYDAKGNKIGHTNEDWIGGGFTHYDNHGNKTGRTEEGLFGGYTHKDASGNVTGYSDRSSFDIKSPEELKATGSLYGRQWYHPTDQENDGNTYHYVSSHSTNYQKEETKTSTPASLKSWKHGFAILCLMAFLVILRLYFTGDVQTIYIPCIAVGCPLFVLYLGLNGTLARLSGEEDAKKDDTDNANEASEDGTKKGG